MQCAERETFEEIGFDARGMLNQEDHISFVVHKKHIRLYIVSGVDESTQFETKTRKEKMLSRAQILLLN